MSLINKNDLIYVAGHNGMVGKAITKFLKNNSYKNLLLPNRKDLDLLNTIEVENWFYEKKPKVVILAAAKVGGIEENNNYTDVNVVANCIDMVYDKEDVYDQFTREESVEFLNSMTQDQFVKVQGFFDTMPRLKHTITWTCPECGETDSVTVEGLQNFFT